VRRFLNKKERKTLIDLFEPALPLETCTREELYISITMWEGHEMKFTPSLTYLYRERDIPVRGMLRKTYPFELIYQGENITWQHSA